MSRNVRGIPWSWKGDKLNDTATAEWTRGTVDPGHCYKPCLLDGLHRIDLHTATLWGIVHYERQALLRVWKYESGRDCQIGGINGARKQIVWTGLTSHSQ